MEKTINYFQFKHIAGNRPVDARHVNELVAKIEKKDLLHLFPILVNSAFDIIDGQHRLAAAEKLKKYIYFRVDDQISKSDIADVNALSKNWSLNDYINFHTVEKSDGFDKLSEFMIDNPLIPPSTVLMMMSKSTKRDINALKQGIVDVSNYDYALQVAAVVREYSGLIKFAYERNFVLAVMKCLATPAYDHRHMQAKLDYQSRSLVRCVKVKHYTEMLAEIYNHSVTAKNQIRIAA